MSLNTNRPLNSLTAADQLLIDQFLAKGGKVTVVPPGDCIDRETVRQTTDAFAVKRKQFRDKRKISRE